MSITVIPRCFPGSLFCSLVPRNSLLESTRKQDLGPCCSTLTVLQSHRKPLPLNCRGITVSCSIFSAFDVTFAFNYMLKAQNKVSNLSLWVNFTSRPANSSSNLSLNEKQHVLTHSKFKGENSALYFPSNQ